MNGLLVESIEFMHLCGLQYPTAPCRAQETSDDEKSSMRRVTPVILAAAGLLVALDIVGALAKRPLGFPYPSLGVVSLLIYLSVGLYGSWRASFAVGVMSAVAVGVLDGTLGPL